MARIGCRSFFSILAVAAMSGSALAAASAPTDLDLTCAGNKYKHGDPFPTPETVTLKISGGKKVSVGFGEGGSGTTESARVLSNNVIQLKFNAKPFTGEYFHFSGDLFLINKDQTLTRLVCKPK
jgi:hypothetical protein